MKFELGEITQNRQQKVGFVEVRNVADVVTASRSDESWPRSENEDRVRAALRGDSFQLVKWVFHGFVRCDHEGPLYVKAVVFFHTATDRGHTAVVFQT